MSDARFKCNVVTIPDALLKIAAISGYTYDRSDGTTGKPVNPDGKRMAGVLAQEVREVLPEVVCVDDLGNLSVAYGNVSALLIQAIKELAADRPATLRVVTTAADEAFTRPLPVLPAGRVAPWKSVVISAATVVAPCCASLDAGAGLVRGRCGAAGEYTILFV
jgi:hypothetical protein